MKVLIVDDNEMNLRLFTVHIRALGYEVLTARDGEEGVRVAKAAQPNLILMDIQMPVMDGIAALHALRSDEQTKDIPVIALTSYAMNGDKERFLDDGFVDYISKPIDMDSFIESVNKAIKATHD
jgi:two-component system, cell cycle response regulator DivK